MERKFYNLSNDYLFKSIFRNFTLLQKMIKDIFGFDLCGYWFISPKITKENKGLSSGECDLVLTNGKNYAIIEMQNRRSGSLENRTTIYMNQFSHLDWQKGDYEYTGIYPVTIFWILNYPYNEKDLLHYQMLEKDILYRFNDGREVRIFIVQSKHERELLNGYQLLLTADNMKKLECLKNKGLEEMIQKIEEYNKEPEMYIEMKRSEIMNWTYEDELKFMRMDGYTEGQKVGEKRGEKRGERRGKIEGKLETALLMLKEGVDISFIQKVTGLTKKQIINGKKKWSEII